MRNLKARTAQSARLTDSFVPARRPAEPAEVSPQYWGNQAALRTSGAGTGKLQRKLEVGSTNDPLEAEADRAADRVMRMPAPSPALHLSCGKVQRKCAECEEEEKKVQKKQLAEAPSVQAPPIVDQAISAPGRPLDAGAMSFFEPRFGAGFSAVRVHDDAQAAESARSIGALAYTAGDHIVFGSGRYQPSTTAGRELLAHELAHTLQQRGNTVRRDRDPAGPVPLQNPSPKMPAARPSSSTMWSAYSKVSYDTLKTAPEVWKFVGGSIGQAFHKADSCATRVSYALNHGGFPIPTADNKTSFWNNPGVVYDGTAGDGMKYIVGAPNMRDFLLASFGPPDAVLTNGKEMNAFDDSLRIDQLAIFAGDAHAGVFYRRDYWDPYVGTHLPVSVWKMA